MREDSACPTCTDSDVSFIPLSIDESSRLSMSTKSWLEASLSSVRKGSYSHFKFASNNSDYKSRDIIKHALCVHPHVKMIYLGFLYKRSVVVRVGCCFSVCLVKVFHQLSGWVVLLPLLFWICKPCKSPCIAKPVTKWQVIHRYPSMLVFKITSLWHCFKCAAALLLEIALQF